VGQSRELGQVAGPDGIIDVRSDPFWKPFIGMKDDIRDVLPFELPEIVSKKISAAYGHLQKRSGRLIMHGFRDIAPRTVKPSLAGAIGARIHCCGMRSRVSRRSGSPTAQPLRG